MNEENYNYIGFGCFFFLIVLIVMIGSIIIYNTKKSKVVDSGSSKTKVVLNDKQKKDKNQEFIYYNLEEVISESLNATYKKANINLKTEDATDVNKKLDDIYSEGLKNIKKSSDEQVCENGSDIYSYTNIDYANYAYDKYITLLVSENFYTCEKEIEIPEKIHAYTFDIITGKLVSYNDLLNNYKITYTEVLDKLKKHLEEEQTIIEELPNIKIDETINELKEDENYGIYVSENNKLVMKYIVKTNSVNYNDIIELN